MQYMLIASVDGLKGSPDAINAPPPQSRYQYPAVYRSHGIPTAALATHTTFKCRVVLATV
jgi:hypothetical protein